MTTVNLQVGDSADDAMENDIGFVYLPDGVVYLRGVGDWGGFRWTGVTVPKDATIDSATFQVYLTTTDHDDIELDIYGEDADNPGTFQGGSTSDISGRTRTSAKVNESASSVGVGWHSMPDVKTIVQEVVDRGGWSSGNALVIVEDCLAGIDVDQRAWDGDSGNAAKLDIDYSVAAAAALPLLSGDGIHSLVFGGVTVR